MEYRSKYKAEEIEAILDAKNNTGEGVDSNLDGLFTSQLQTKEVEVSEDTTIKADEGFLGLKEVSVKVSGSGGSASGDGWVYFDLRNSEYRNDFLFLTQHCPVFLCGLMEYTDMVQYGVTIEAYNNNNSREQLANNLYGMAMYLGGIIKAGGMQFTNEEYINLVTSQIGITNPIDKVPRITKEQFYTL